MTLVAARLTSNELANPRTLISEELFDRLTARVAVAENLPAVSAERVIEQTLAFLVACALNPDKALSPSAPVDPGWHAFLTYTRAYADFCRRVAGRFIHHTPTDAPGAVTTVPIEAVGATVAAMRAAGLPVAAELWVPAGRCSQCHQGCYDSPKEG